MKGKSKEMIEESEGKMKGKKRIMERNERKQEYNSSKNERKIKSERILKRKRQENETK